VNDAATYEATATKIGGDMGLEIAQCLFEGKKERLEHLLVKRQRRINLCRKKWGESVARAFNRGLTAGLFKYAKMHSDATGTPLDQAEAVITDWSGGLKERMEREQREAREQALRDGAKD
jgi:hypothetical protein